MLIAGHRAPTQYPAISNSTGSLPRSRRRRDASELRGGHQRRRPVEHRVEQQLVGRAGLRAEIDLAAHRHHVSLAHAKRHDVGLVAQQILTEEPAAPQDLPVLRIPRRDVSGSAFSIGRSKRSRAVSTPLPIATSVPPPRTQSPSFFHPPSPTPYAHAHSLSFRCGSSPRTTASRVMPSGSTMVS